MSGTPYTPPGFEREAFNCPHCGAFAHQRWTRIFYGTAATKYEDEAIRRATCGHCNRRSIWINEKMVYPEASGTPLVNPDLNDDIKADYNEAAAIVNKSPRGAAALLRLAIQKTCQQLGQPGENLDRDIGALVAAGTIPARIQQALDIVRVVGNNAVHPGELDLKDDRETAMQLFKLVNLIAEVAITEPKRIEALYQTLPQGAREAIEKRDS